VRVEVDLEICQGYANCVVEAPDVFDLNESTNKAVVLVETVPEELEEDAQQAVDNCPVGAITIHP
jgi:ferredoxin